jgi:hypothetical protein
MQYEADRNQELLKSMEMMELQMKSSLTPIPAPASPAAKAVTDTAKP